VPKDVLNSLGVMPDGQLSQFNLPGIKIKEILIQIGALQ
jgi:hypothetical protein